MYSSALGCNTGMILAPELNGSTSSPTIHAAHLMHTTSIINLAETVVTGFQRLCQYCKIDPNFVGMPLVECATIQMFRRYAPMWASFDRLNQPITLIPVGHRGPNLRFLVTGFQRLCQYCKIDPNFVGMPLVGIQNVA